MASQIHVNDVGTRFKVTIKDDGTVVDISTATLLQLNFRKPSDEKVIRTASTLSDGSALSGVIYYDSVVGDLDEIGNYKIQGKVTFPSGTFFTDIHTFKVHCNL